MATLLRADRVEFREARERPEASIRATLSNLACCERRPEGARLARYTSSGARDAGGRELTDTGASDSVRATRVTVLRAVSS